jgi:hypothetical protein
MARYKIKRRSEPRNEAQLQNNVWAMIIESYPNAWLFHPVGGPYQKPGIPDLLIVIDGMLIGLELKHPKPGESADHARSRATPQQRKEIRRINAAGGYACVVVSEAEAARAIKRAFHKRDAALKEKGWTHG